MNDSKPKIKITLPNLLMIPGLSIVFAVIKMCGGLSWNWGVVLVLAPMLTYIGWTMFFFVVVAICLMIRSMTMN